MQVRILDGARSVGGTKIHVENGGRGFLIDFGISFGRHGELFDSMVKPRGALGFGDAWDLGMIPRLEGIYRSDAAPRGRSLRGEQLPVEALALSHAHADHAGLIGYLRSDLPIHTSAVTAAILRATQATGPADLPSETTRAVLRQTSTFDPRGLATTRGDVDAVVRPLVLSDRSKSPELEELWNRAPSKTRSRGVQRALVANSSGEIAGVPYEVWPVDHSIYGCLGFVFHCARGPVVYTGDLRFHGKQGTQTRAFVEHLAKIRPALLIIEGTRIGRAAKRNVTESDVAERAAEIVGRAKGLVIADFGARHLERAESFLDVARRCGRSLVLCAKDVHLLESIATADPRLGFLRDTDWLLRDKIRSSAPQAWEREILDRYKSRLVSPKDIGRSQGDFILAMSWWDAPDLLSINPSRPDWIYSSSEAYSEDSRIQLGRLCNWIDHFDGRLHGYDWHGTGDQGQPDFGNGRLNASGHLSEDELRELILEVRPRAVLPCHTAKPEWFAHALADESIELISEEWRGA